MFNLRLLSPVLSLSLLAFTAETAQAKSFVGNWELKQSELTYHIAYVLKKFSGTSLQAKGKGRCDSKTCEFLLGIPVKSFDSGDTNRDAHMLESGRPAESNVTRLLRPGWSGGHRRRFRPEPPPGFYDLGADVRRTGSYRRSIQCMRGIHVPPALGRLR